MEIEKELKNKKIILSSIGIVIFLAFVVWITGYVSLNKKINEKKSITHVQEMAKNESINEELKNEISSKVSQIMNLGYRTDDTLFFQDNENIPYIKLYDSTNEEEKDFFSSNIARFEKILESKEITIEERAYIALKQVNPTKLTIDSKNIKNETVKKAVIQDEDLNIKTDILQIDEKRVEEQYEKLFNTKMNHKTIEGCPSFYYDKQNKVYYYMERCGDVSLTNTYLSVYKDNYLKREDEITVEVTIAYVEEITEYAEEERKKPTGVYISKRSDFKKEIKQEIGTEFKIDESNKKNFDTYKFIFKKNHDGNYYFDTIIQVVK